MNPLTLVALLAISGAHSSSAIQKKKPVKPPVKPQINTTKTQQQQVGGPGVFGTTYSIVGTTNNFNISLDRAWYDVASPASTQGFIPTTEKLLYTKWSFKNTSPGSQGVGRDAMTVSIVFADGSTKDDFLIFYRQADLLPLTMDFKPGQGINDAVAALIIPSAAKVTKIILNSGRAFVKDEKVIRYFIVGGGTDTKPDPKNVIDPVPTAWRDTTDASGAKALNDAPAQLGQEYFISMFATTVESLTIADKFADITAAEDQKLLVATLKIRNPFAQTISFGTTGMRSGLEATVLDGDGETASVESQWYKASREEPVGDHDILAGETYRVRVVFAIRKFDKPLKTIRLREAEYKSRGLIFDGSKLAGSL